LKERKTSFCLFHATAINVGKESILGAQPDGSYPLPNYKQDGSRQKQTNEFGKRGKKGRQRALKNERKEFFFKKESQQRGFELMAH